MILRNRVRNANFAGCLLEKTKNARVQLSKLKTVNYLYRYQGVSIGIDTVYKFLDKLNATLKDQVEQITYKHTLKILKNNSRIIF
jgi:hypothetical protein